MEWVHQKALEGTIDAIQDRGLLRLTCTIIWKTPMHSSTIRSQITQLGGIKSRVENLRVHETSVRDMAASAFASRFPEPSTAGTRWLHLLAGTLKGLPLPELCERYGLTIQALERAFAVGMVRGDFQKVSVESLVLHHLIHKRLGTLCRLGALCLGPQQCEATEPLHQPAAGRAAPADCSTMLVHLTPAPFPSEPVADPSSSSRRSAAPAKRRLGLESASIGAVLSPGKLDLGCERSLGWPRVVR